VNYYPRSTTFFRHISLLPFNVISRNSEQLLQNLVMDDYPILFDGLHTTYFLNNHILAARTKIVRVHNIEHLYYSTLAKYEMNPVKKLYFLIESLKLKQYEKVLHKAEMLFTISESDQEYFERKYKNSVLIPSFHPFDHIESRPGTGDYIIYHADLSVNENVAVSEFLISKVFSRIPFRCIIAGKNPPGYLHRKVLPFSNISIISNPDSDYMVRLIKDAQMNILISKASNGLKIKLLISLFSGRHCLVNSTMLKGTCLAPVSHIADSTEIIIEKIHILMQQPFTKKMIEEREKILMGYSNTYNAKKLSGEIFSDLK
jgi:hypothetical protein